MSEISDFDMEDVLQIDIVFDVVCFWCIVGFKQFEQVIQWNGVLVVIKWYLFEFNFDMVVEGENLCEYIMCKYGLMVEQLQVVCICLIELGGDLGIDFWFKDESCMVNIYKVYQFLYWVGLEGLEYFLKMVLFEVYFWDGKDLNDNEVFVDVVVVVGLDWEEVVKVIDDVCFVEVVCQEEYFWIQNGI